MAKRPKYGNKKIEINGTKFDSVKESKRYQGLQVMEVMGEIYDLELQPKFELIKSVKFAGTDRAKPAIRYFADFAYTDTLTGKRIVEDVKSKITRESPVYRMKKHMMLAIHGIEINEVWISQAIKQKHSKVRFKSHLYAKGAEWDWKGLKRRFDDD